MLASQASQGASSSSTTLYASFRAARFAHTHNHLTHTRSRKSLPTLSSAALLPCLQLELWPLTPSVFGRNTNHRPPLHRRTPHGMQPASSCHKILRRLLVRWSRSQVSVSHLSALMSRTDHCPRATRMPTLTQSQNQGAAAGTGAPAPSPAPAGAGATATACTTTCGGPVQ